MTRVLVIGAGSNGLVAAIHLARAGLDVEILEHGAQPGGATASRELTLPGFTHDTCAGFNPLSKVSDAMLELELDIDWIDPPTVMAYPVPDGTAIALHRDLDATVASLEAAAPGSGRAWRALVDQIAPHAGRLWRTVLNPLPPSPGGPLRLAFALRRDVVEFVRRSIGSAEAFGLEQFGGAQYPTAWLASSSQHSGLGPETALSGAFGFLLQLLGHTHGWPFPRGGQQRLADALLALATDAGATLRCSATVERIAVRGGRVRGVHLAGGEEVPAEAVVSTVSAGLLARMVPDGALPSYLARRLRTWRYGTAAFKVDYALSGPVPWTAPECREAGVVQVGAELVELARAAHQAHAGEVPDRPALVIGQHTVHDPGRAPDGQHTLYVYSHVPQRPDLPDEEIAARVEAQIERFAPGFGATIIGRALRGPAATEAANPSMVGGDIGGGSYEPDQQLIFRPAPEMSRGRTPLRGLYVAGSSVHPGGAVHGLSGRAAARALLADRRLRPWRAV